MANGMKKTAGMAVFMTICCFVLYRRTANGILLTLTITSGTVAYHFLVRLLVGTVFDGMMHNRADDTRRWYRVSDAEMDFYRKIRVKKWKNKMPTYDAAAFDTTKHSWEELLQTMCQAEMVHETNVILSFVPVAASAWLGAFPVFMITSVLSAVFDLMFVWMQRFNRARILKLKNRISPPETA